MTRLKPPAPGHRRRTQGNTMTDLRKAAEQALDALRYAMHVGFDESSESQIKKGDKAVMQHGEAIAALREALAKPDVPEWQPIETAPKDGRALLLGYANGCGNWRTMRGEWMSDDYIAENWEFPENGEAGWFETAVNCDEPPNCWSVEPTHWMPLPAAPQPKDKP